MLPTPPGYASALRGPHRRVSYITSTDIDGNVLAADVPIVSGSVRASLTDRVTRVSDFALPPEYFPSSPTDPFAPEQCVVHIRSGIALGNNAEITFPVFTGRAYAATLTEDGQAQFRADDLAADVVAARFEQPWQSSRSLLAYQVEEIERIILDAVPQAVFGDHDVVNQRVPILVWDEDRGQALDDLSASMGGRWYALGDGSFVVRRFGYGSTDPVAEFLDGPQGLLHSARVTRTRDGSANSVVVISERLDGTDPVRVVRRDTGLNSPTRFGGRFGKVVQVIKLQTPQTQGDATVFADAQLTAAVALTEQWSASVTPDQAVEPGDCVRLRYRGRMADQILDSVTYPLDAGTPMTLNGRSAVPTQTTGV